MYVLLRIHKDTDEIDAVVCPVTNDEYECWPWPAIETKRYRFELEETDWNSLTEFLSSPMTNPILKEKLADVVKA